MAYIELEKGVEAKKKIMIFTEGTILIPRRKRYLWSFKNYIPEGNCMEIIREWQQQGAEIVYCTSRKKKGIYTIAKIISQYGLCGTRLYYREKHQKYKDLVEEYVPDILIEDDCKSIGGSSQMCITHVNSELRDQIISIAVPEFGGIDHLALEVSKLLEA